MSVLHLPAPTRDVEVAKRDIDEFGYSMIADALTPHQVAAMRARLIEQAECESAAVGGKLSVDDEMVQTSIGSLLNKGAVWQELLDPNSDVHQVVDHVFTPSFTEAVRQKSGLEQNFLMSSMGAGFKRREERGTPFFHIDQAFAPGHLDYPLVLNVFYLLTDYNSGNGATLFVPGSHKRLTPEWGTYSDEGAVVLEAPAGTAIIFEGRTWHAAGINTSGELRAIVTGFYCAPYVRQREMLPMNLRQDVVDQLSDAQLKLLGFDTMFQGPAGAFVGFGLIEGTLGRGNVSHTMTSFGELSR